MYAIMSWKAAKRIGSFTTSFSVWSAFEDADAYFPFALSMYVIVFSLGSLAASFLCGKFLLSECKECSEGKNFLCPRYTILLRCVQYSPLILQ